MAASTSGNLSITCDWTPQSEFQHALVNAQERIIDGTGGRRVGKSDGLAPWITGLHPGIQKYRWGAVWCPGGRFLYTAPQRSPNCVDFYEKLKSALFPLIVDKSDVELYLKLYNDATIECKSTERPDNLRGPGYDGIATDEKGTTPEEAIHILRPMLSDPPEHCIRRWLRVGSPRGKKHWSYREHLASSEGPRGKEGRIAFVYPTWSRPGPEIAREVEEARRSLPDPVFRQEYGAEFLDSAVGYFQAWHYDNQPAPLGPEPGALYTAGLDLAHADDWTVVAVVRAKPKPWRLVALHRWQRQPWPVMKPRVIEVLKKWNADALLDATPGGAPGEVVVEAFAPEWKKMSGFDFRSQEGAGREDMLAHLAIKMDAEDPQDRLWLPGSKLMPAFPILESEISAFTYEAMASGKFRAQASTGYNDDTVVALGMAAWRAKTVGSGGYASRKHF